MFKSDFTNQEENTETRCLVDRPAILSEEALPVGPKPRRYEVRDVETGEKLSGVSFILTPTGEEMHLLTEPGKYVGPMQDIGVYYHGELHGGISGADSLPTITPIALEETARYIYRQLATGLHPKRQNWGIESLKRLGETALKMYEEHSQGSDRD